MKTINYVIWLLFLGTAVSVILPEENEKIQPQVPDEKYAESLPTSVIASGKRVSEKAFQSLLLKNDGFRATFLDTLYHHHAPTH